LILCWNGSKYEYRSWRKLMKKLKALEGRKKEEPISRNASEATPPVLRLEAVLFQTAKKTILHGFVKRSKICP
jgi:hypothetical protein